MIKSRIFDFILMKTPIYDSHLDMDHGHQSCVTFNRPGHTLFNNLSWSKVSKVSLSLWALFFLANIQDTVG